MNPLLLKTQDAGRWMAEEASNSCFERRRGVMEVNKPSVAQNVSRRAVVGRRGISSERGV